MSNNTQLGLLAVRNCIGVAFTTIYTKGEGVSRVGAGSTGAACGSHEGKAKCQILKT